MTIARWIVRAAIAAAVVVQGIAAWRTTTFDRHYREAVHAYGAERFSESLEGFLAARGINGDDADIWEWSGDAAANLYRHPSRGPWDDPAADQLLQTAWGGYAGTVLRSPLNTWSWSGLAEVALDRAERRDAKAGVSIEDIDRRAGGVLDVWRGIALVAARTAVELKPSGFQELDVLTRVYTASGQLDAARESLVRSAAIMPAPSFHVWGEGQRFVRPLYDAVMTAMRQGLERTPDFERSGLHLQIARFAMSYEDYDAALSEMRAAEASVQSDNDRQLALRGVAQVLEAMGRLDEAIVAWSALIDSGLSFPPDTRQRGIVLDRAGRKRDACRDLRESVGVTPEDDGLRTLAAGACEEAGELDTAERLLRDGFSVPTEDPALARGLVELYARNGRRGTAQGLVQAWSRDYPDRADEFRRWAAEVLGSPKP